MTQETQIEFKERPCRRCHGDGEVFETIRYPRKRVEHAAVGEWRKCWACNGTGVFRARLKSDWKLPSAPVVGAYPEAVHTDKEWQWLGWRTDDGEEHGEIDWPFVTDWANAEDLEVIGFEVVCE